MQAMTFQCRGGMLCPLSPSFSRSMCFGLNVKLCHLDPLQTFHCDLSLAGDCVPLTQVLVVWPLSELLTSVPTDAKHHRDANEATGEVPEGPSWCSKGAFLP